MKVERKEDNAFIPIHITIDNEEEARTLWHVLNCPVGVPLDNYLLTEGIRLDDYSVILQDIFEVYDRVYNLRRLQSG